LGSLGATSRIPQVVPDETEIQQSLAKCKGRVPVIDAETKKLLEKLRASGRNDLIEKADQVEADLKASLARRCAELKDAGRY